MSKKQQTKRKTVKPALVFSVLIDRLAHDGVNDPDLTDPHALFSRAFGVSDRMTLAENKESIVFTLRKTK